MTAESHHRQSFPEKCNYEQALTLAGFGLYSYSTLVSSIFLILAMYMDIFGLSVVLPAVACDLQLGTKEQALLSAIPLIGVMLSSYVWGLSADRLGRRSTLLAAMTIGVVLNILACFAPNYGALASLKFFSASFTSSANAAAFVLVGETTPERHRNQFMFLMASATMLSQFIICTCTLPTFSMTFRVTIPWLALELRPWRLVLLIISMPGVIGVFSLLAIYESPKFLLGKGRDTEALEVLKKIHLRNKVKGHYLVAGVSLNEPLISSSQDVSFIGRMWNQTSPLFKPPLLKNSLKLYFILLCAYMTSTGFTMWVPTMSNAFFGEEDQTGKTFCQVASTVTRVTTDIDNTPQDCNHVLNKNTLYAVMFYSGVSGALNVTLSFLVKAIGKKRMTIITFGVSSVSGAFLLFVRIPMLNIALFYLFLYVALILGNINSYLVELNPTYLRGMATCLSVVVARGFGFISVQLIAALLADHCTFMISGYLILVLAGGLVAFSLPIDEEKQEKSDD